MATTVAASAEELARDQAAVVAVAKATATPTPKRTLERKDAMLSATPPSRLPRRAQSTEILKLQDLDKSDEPAEEEEKKEEQETETAKPKKKPPIAKETQKALKASIMKVSKREGKPADKSKPPDTGSKPEPKSKTAAKTKPQPSAVKLERQKSTEVPETVAKAVQESLKRKATADLSLTTPATTGPDTSSKRKKTEAAKATKATGENANAGTKTQKPPAQQKQRSRSKSAESSAESEHDSPEHEEEVRMKKAAHAMFMRFRRSFKRS